MSIRLKITLWFTIALLIVAGLTFFVVLSTSYSVMQKTVRENMVEFIENNSDEIEFYKSMDEISKDNDNDSYIQYNDGFLQIDDDFLKVLNGIYAALYNSDGELLYGENPVAVATGKLVFADGCIQKVKSNGVTYYVYDRMLTQYGTDGLCLRGIVSEEQGKGQLTGVAKLSVIIMPFIVVLAIGGGYLVADRALFPIKSINDAAYEITHDKDLKRRIEAGNGKDELHELATTFNGMLDTLDKTFEAEKQLTRDVSHEMRTPLSVITMQCEIADEQDVSNEELLEAIATIRRQTSRLTRLVNDILNFTRMENNVDSYAMNDMDLSRTVSSICTDLALLKENGIVMHMDIMDNIHINGNGELVAVLLSNLVTNAYRYGRENGNIYVELKEKAGAAILAVTDDGIGIEKLEQEKIFGKFYKVDKSRNAVGTGLGLCMVSIIADIHDAKLSVESEKGKGSSFMVEFPKK